MAGGEKTAPSRPRRISFPWRSRGEIHRDIDDELSFHLDCTIDELRAAGLDEGAARAEARRRFGDVERAATALKAAGRRRESQRRRELMVDEFLRDLRYAARSLRRSPGFTLTAVLVLALGIGINSAIFSVVNMLLMRPMLVHEPERLAGLYARSGEADSSWQGFSYPLYVDIRDGSGAFSELAAHTISLAGITEGDLTRRVMAGIVSSNFFDTLGVRLHRGRTFSAAEEEPKSEAPVVIVSHAYSQRHGGDVLGSLVTVNGRSLTVVGVAPAGFTGTTALVTPELWLPLGLFETLATMPGAGGATDLMDRENQGLMVFGRLAPGLELESADSRLEPLARRLEQTYPAIHQNQVLVTAALPRLTMSTEPNDEAFLTGPVLLIMAMGGVVLLIACLNLANMFLARGASRRVEMAIRLSLGGGRLRLLRLLLGEAFLLSLLGGVGGLLLATWATRALFASLVPLIPLGMSVTLDTSPDVRVFAATLLFCLLATVLAGLGPAWRQASGDVLEGLKEAAGQGSGGGHRLAPRSLLLVAQIAFSLALLSAGGLFMRGAQAAGDQTPGFSIEQTILAELDTDLAGYETTRGRQTYRRLLDELRALPGVEAASASSIVPFGSVTSRRRVMHAGQADPEQAELAHQYTVTDGHFAALGLPILRGRDFRPGEVFEPSAARVAIIDRPLAEQLWPDEEQPALTAVGRTIQMSRQGEMVDLEVVGVVPGIRHQITDQEPPPHLYLPLAQQFAANLHLHLRLGDSIAEQSMMQQVRDEVRRLDAGLPVLRLVTMQQHRDQSLFLWLVEAGATFFSALGLLALVLSLVGVYGVNAFMVSERTREIGVRMALGATRRSVLAQMLRESLRLTALGLGAGVVLALGVAQLLRSLIFQVSGEALAVTLAAGLLLAAAVLLAALLPARRATAIEPLQALRQA